MKKAILLLGALLAVSTGTVAEETGFIRTAVETGTVYYEDGNTKKFTDFILTDGFFASRKNFLSAKSLNV